MDNGFYDLDKLQEKIVILQLLALDESKPKETRTAATKGAGNLSAHYWTVKIADMYRKNMIWETFADE